MKKDIPQKIIFAFFFAVLLAPLLQHNLNIIDSGKLFGYMKDSANVSFNVQDWWEGNYQRKKSFYLNDSFGFRSDFVRLNNQLDYYLYNRINVNNTVAGKNGVLYEKSYIDEYNGVDFKGDSAVRVRLLKLKAIQDTLTRLGKTFVFIYAPSKAYFFPQDFPDDMRMVPKRNNYYRTVKRISDSLGINQIDFNNWFVKMKGKTDGMLMSKGGVHWTYYGALMAADSIVRYIEKARYIDMPNFCWKKTAKGTPRDQEVDMSAAANLMFPLAQEDYVYPELIEENDSLKTKPDIIFLGDSFLWTLVYNNVLKQTSKNWEFWYYFYEMWSPEAGNGQNPTVELEHYDWFKSMRQKDCFVMLYTEKNLEFLGTGFIEQAYDKFHPKK